MAGTEGQSQYSVAFAALCLTVLLFIGSIVNTLLYNLYRHPLAHFPGPKLAGATYLYQTYFSLIGGSKYYIEIAKMHEKYGPVVRITPDEIHLSDPDNYEVMHCVGTKYPKSTQFYNGFGIGYSTFSAGPIHVHKPRRAMLDPYFSRKNVLALEHLVQARAENISDILTTKLAKGEAVDLHHAFRAISVDVISDYAFGESYGLLDTPDFGHEFFDMVSGIGPTMWFFQQFPAIQMLAMSLPAPIAKMTSKPLKQVLTLQEHCRAQVFTVKEKMEKGEAIERSSIFEALLTPAEDYIVPTPDQIKDEAYSILAAAADTTGNAMTVAAYQVVVNPEIYKRLTAELKEAFPDANQTLDYMALEKLPYLTGVVKEGLRLSFGVAGRLPRIVPELGATFNGYFLPAGSFVSMSSWILHHNEKYFSDSKKFDPTRWLDLNESRRIDKAFVPFCKGTRGCVGINLAYCELYCTLGTIFRRFENLQSNRLTEDDLSYNDYFTTHHPIGAAKFHVMAGEQK